ncbi:hypothetical protein NZ47_11465 [Anaerovibrio lipolyticus]|uniref:Uncharacterized protein n=1 Tax=Anaerovibrio lipolyticus TaxID=82374 RepID=A0A0B2JX64_9FIRM|nr:hypothetical protein [Anaerovibrio lipolyticus]KHM51273.1 hypothetical protein NZ47_11465 [Anaerovibrio lipolyticus]
MKNNLGKNSKKTNNKKHRMSKFSMAPKSRNTPKHQSDLTACEEFREEFLTESAVKWMKDIPEE